MNNPFAPIPATLVILVIGILFLMWVVCGINHYLETGPEYDHEEGEGRPPR